jgi:Tfp pilus assembly protein PilW
MRNKTMMYTQAGLSLVEMMVGMVVGLLATLVIMQAFSAGLLPARRMPRLTAALH